MTDTYSTYPLTYADEPINDQEWKEYLHKKQLDTEKLYKTDSDC